MSSSAITTQVAQLKAGNIQNQADSSSIYSAGVWSFKNSTAVASVTITDAGNVGIGTGAQTPTVRLDVRGASNPSIKVWSGGGSSGNYAELMLHSYNSFSGFGQTYIRALSTAAGNSATALTFATEDNGFGGPAERMRIEASGNLLVGKTASNFLTVGAQLNTTGAVWGSTGGNADAIAGYNKTTLTQQVIYAGYSDIGGVGSSKFFAFADGNVRIAAGSTYGNFSDIKFKENIVDATPKLEDVLRLQVRNFTIKNEGLKAIGFIAQEFEQVFPALVVTSPDKDMEGNELGTESKAIKESALIPVLVKAIQEQQAQIESLKAEVAALKAP